MAQVVKRFSYSDIMNRIEELNNKRDNNERFIGTMEELDEMCYLSTYNRESFGHALCLDLKTDIEELDERRTFRAVIDEKPCLIKVTGFESSYSYVAQAYEIERKQYFFGGELFTVEVLKELVKTYIGNWQDRAGFDCYFFSELDSTNEVRRTVA